jgi:hypothetical protein
MRKMGLFGDFARVDSALANAVINEAASSKPESPGQITKERAFKPLFW